MELWNELQPHIFELISTLGVITAIIWKAPKKTKAQKLTSKLERRHEKNLKLEKKLKEGYQEESKLEKEKKQCEE